jgi:hypothetical protein
MISPWKWLVATLAGVLVAASVVVVARMGIRHAGNPATLWRNTSSSAKGSLERLKWRGNSARAERERERSGEFVADPPSRPQRI